MSVGADYPRWMQNPWRTICCGTFDAPIAHRAFHFDKREKMPIYEYACADCGKEFEALVRSGSTPECPACHSTHLEKQLSVFATTATQDAAPAMPSPCGSCGNPNGPGSCAFNH